MTLCEAYMPSWDCLNEVSVAKFHSRKAADWTAICFLCLSSTPLIRAQTDSQFNAIGLLGKMGQEEV